MCMDWNPQSQAFSAFPPDATFALRPNKCSANKVAIGSSQIPTLIGSLAKSSQEQRNVALQILRKLPTSWTHYSARQLHCECLLMCHLAPSFRVVSIQV